MFCLSIDKKHSTDTAYLYNDRSVLENLHLSTAFQVLRKEECNILSNLSKEEYRYEMKQI